MRTRTAAAVAALLLGAMGTLGACSDDESSVEGGDGVVRTDDIELGAEISYDDWLIAEGWELDSDTQQMGVDQALKPIIRANATNEGDEARFALFEFVFTEQGTVVSKIHCTSLDKIKPGEQGPLICDGIGQPVPEEYDRILVQPISD